MRRAGRGPARARPGPPRSRAQRARALAGRLFGGGGALGRHLLSRRAVDYLVAHGYSCILWNSVPRDWGDPGGWPARALADCAARSHTLVVLHDIPNACLAGLAGFLDALGAGGFELACDVPPACAPIIDGRIVADLDDLVAAG